LRAKLHTLGKPIGYYDILIAATAVQHNLIMVTANTLEFKQIEKLKIRNWRELFQVL
jgi:tRNA(fMet)-specific endonuclease VapC